MYFVIAQATILIIITKYVTSDPDKKYLSLATRVLLLAKDWGAPPAGGL